MKATRLDRLTGFPLGDRRFTTTALHLRNPFDKANFANIVDATIRNVDEAAYRSLKAWAAQHGMNVGEALSEILRLHLGPGKKAGRALADWPAWDLGPGTERLSEEVDDVLYGKR